MRVLVVVNDQAGVGDAGLYQFVRLLGLAANEVTLRYVTEGVTARSLVADASDFDRVVVAAGDGTVSAVCYAVRQTKVPVLAYPAGTANLLATNLGLPQEPPALARLLLEGPTSDIDLGEIEVEEADGAITRTGFALMAGAGYDASIMEKAEALKPTLGVAAYFIAAATHLTPTNATFDLLIDGQRVTADGIAVLVTNFSRIQFDVSLAPGADPCDGVLDVAVLKSKTTVGLLPAFTAAMFLDREGGHIDRSGTIEVHSGTEIEVSARPRLRMQADGEVLGTSTPFKVRVLPRAATIIVPDDSRLLEA